MKVSIDRAQELLRCGEVVAVPTDTVYGIAADMYSERGILKLYNLKGRKLQKPLVVQLAQGTQITSFLSHIPFDLDRIIQRFWPGQLTLVLPVKEDQVPGILRAHLPTAAFRVSDNALIRRLISEYGPLAVTSANTSGMKELLDPDEIEENFGKSFPILSEEKTNAIGKASTILAYIDAGWVILRLGPISLKELNQTLGYYPPFVTALDFSKKQYTIAPQLHLMDHPYDGSIKVVLGFSDRQYPQAEQVIYLGSLSQTFKIEDAIIKAMREINQEGYPHVWVDMNFPKDGHLKELARILERACEIKTSL